MNSILQDIVDIYLDVPRRDMVIKNELSYSDELTKKKYLIRSEVQLNTELIKRVEQYEGNFYMETKEITLKQLKSLVAEVEAKDEKYLVAKFH